MPYQPVAIDRFSGLQLADDPEEIGFGAAVDLLNVDVSTRGRLTTRAGTLTYVDAVDPADLVQSVAAFRPLAAVGSPEEYLAVSYKTGAATGYVGIYDEAAATVTTRPDLAGNIIRVGDATSSRVLYPDGSDVIQWFGVFSTISLPSGDAHYIATSPVDNRLVVGAADTGLTRVYFSEPDDPTTINATNYVDVDPGDGEEIQGIATWRTSTFVFKESKFYEFFGSSIDALGEPVFNYRPVRSGIGVRPGTYSDPPRVVSARDGIYFIGPDGIYRTTGGEPVKVSAPLDPWFRGQTLPLATSLPAATTDVSLSADHRFVYFRAGTRTFVLDTQTGEWTLYSLAIRHATATSTRTWFGLTGKVVTYSPSYTTDDGSAIGWSYRSGSSDLGIPEQKIVAQVQVWGTGAPTLSVYADHATTDPGSEAIGLGASPTVSDAIHSYSREGTFFSVGLSGSGRSVIHRAVLGVRHRRLAGVS